MNFLERTANRFSLGRFVGAGPKLPEIDRALARLKQFETDLKNPEVEQALLSARRIIDPHYEWFNSRGIVITYHGSLQYHDPRNLDVDMAFFSKDLNYEVVREKYTELEVAFSQPGAWPRSRCDTNFFYQGINEIRDGFAQAGPEMEYGEGNFDEFDEIYDSTTGASFILSSALLYQSQRPLFRIYQAETRRLLEGSKWGRGGVLEDLNETIKIRMERRMALLLK